MMESEFRDFLRSLHGRDGGRRFQERTIQNRVSNCKNVERHEGDPDRHIKTDQCRDLLQRLTYSTRTPHTNNPPDNKIHMMATSEPVHPPETGCKTLR